MDRSLEDDGVEVGQTLGFGPARIPVEVAGFVDDTTFNLQAAVWMDPTTWNGVVRANVPAATLAPGSSQALLVTSTNGSEPTATAAIEREVEGVTALTSRTRSSGSPAVRPAVDLHGDHHGDVRGRGARGGALLRAPHAGARRAVRRAEGDRLVVPHSPPG